MSNNEEQAKIPEAEVKAAEEKLVESIGIDVSAVSPIVTETTVSATATATIITPVTPVTALVAAELTDKIGLSMISESTLTEEQKKLATQLYDSTKEAIKSFIDSSLNNTVKITKTISQLIKQLEGVKVNGKSLSGADKKAVAIQLGRILIKEVTPADKGEILMIYDLVAEQTLEAIIDVSKVVNVAVKKIATKCCPSLFSFFKRTKSS